MLGGHRNRFASRSKLLNIERPGEERPLPAEKQKSGRNKCGVRADGG
jgi:hypothetical protein